MNLRRSRIWRIISFLAVLGMVAPVRGQQSTHTVERIRQLERALQATEGDNPQLARLLRKELEQSLANIEDQLAPSRRYQEHAAARFANDTQYVAKLLERFPLGSQALRDAFREELRRLQDGWKDGSIYWEPTKEPLVQWVHSGAPLPQGPSSSCDGRLPIQLEVQSLDRPTIIALSSQHATTWKLRIQPHAKVLAVILLNQADVVESDQPLLLYHREAGYRQLHPEAVRHVTAVLEHEVGREMDLLLPIYATAAPVVLGPEDATWTRAALASLLRDLTQQVRDHLNSLFARAHEDLRFPAIAVHERGFTRTTQLAEFDLRGPIVGTQRPTGTAIWNHERWGEHQAFGLIHAGLLAVWSHETQAWEPIAKPSQIARGTFFNTFCVDTRRQRLVLLDSDGTLYGYSPASSEWQILRFGMPPLVALAYDAERDEIIGIRQREQGTRDRAYSTALIRLDGAGNTLQQLSTECRVPLRDYRGRTGPEVILTKGHLIAVQPPAGGRFGTPRNSVIRVFDVANGQMTYEYKLTAPNGDAFASRGAGNLLDQTRYAAFAERTRTAQQAIDDVRQVDPELAAELTARLVKASDPIAFWSQPREKPRVCWVRTFYGPAPTIRITDNSGPIILALSSFSVRQWMLEIDEGVAISKVIFVGDKTPDIRGLPAGIRVASREYSEQDQQRRNARQPQFLQDNVEELAGASVDTEVDLGSLGGQSVMDLGPTNADLAIRNVLRELNAIIRTATQRTHDQGLPESFRFAFPYQGPLLLLEPSPAALHLVECNFRGPILQTARVTDEAMPQAVTLVRPGTMIGGASERGLFQFVRLDDSLRESPLIAAAEQYHASEVMHDANTGRLFCFSSHGLHMQEHSRWKTVTVQLSEPPVAICRDNMQQCFYAFMSKRRQLVEVHTLSEEGKTTQVRKLPVPIPCEFHADGRRCFAICNSEHIILVIRQYGGRDTDQNQVYVLDVESLQILYEGEFRPHVEFQPMTNREFTRLWSQLGVDDEAAAAAVMWRLISGLEDSAIRISYRLGIVESMSRARVDELVAQLDADRFAPRDQAQRLLLANAKSHADYLAQKLEPPTPEDAQAEGPTKLSPEQRARIKGILSLWQDSEIRVERAGTVLNRIDTEIRARQNAADAAPSDR